MTARKKAADTEAAPPPPGVIRMQTKNGPRDYHTVAKRIVDFRLEHGIDSGWTLETECVHLTDKTCRFIARILNGKGKVVATGTAYEERINLDSYLQNAFVEITETSAVGRCLAFAGYVGSEVASADEMRHRIDRDEQRTHVIDEYVPRVLAMISTDDRDGFQQLWDELGLIERDDVFAQLDSHKRGVIRKWQTQRYLESDAYQTYLASDESTDHEANAARRAERAQTAADKGGQTNGND